MLSDWSIAGTRGRSLIYHLIHPNSHPDVLWPLFTLSLSHIHTYIDMQIHYLGSPVISTLSPLPILLFNTRTHTQSRKLDHWCLHYFCQAVPVTMGLIIYQHTHTGLRGRCLWFEWHWKSIFDCWLSGCILRICMLLNEVFICLWLWYHI